MTAMGRTTRDEQRPPLVVICGPTAAGKTAFSLELAERFGAEIVSADSRQVYRGMDIGTAKATAEERARIPHHLIDVAEVDEDYSVADFAVQGRRAILDISARGKRPFVVGGTGLYIRALTEGLLDAPAGDPQVRQAILDQGDAEGEGALYRRLQRVDPPLAERLKPRDQVRIVRGLEVFEISGRRLSDLQEGHAFAEQPYPLLVVGVTLARDELYRRIDGRVEAMVAGGLVEEVSALLARGFSPGLKALRTIGYQEIIRHLAGEISLDEAVALIQRDSRRYAKRQLTWFRRDKKIIWVDSLRESAKIPQMTELFYAAKRSGHAQNPI